MSPVRRFGMLGVPFARSALAWFALVARAVVGGSCSRSTIPSTVVFPFELVHDAPILRGTMNALDLTTSS
jgi:hypothetical protein